MLGLSPEFKKLNNPILRRTIAKVANLKQAAEIGNIPLDNFINTLREAVGQTRWLNQSDEVENKTGEKPDWIQEKNITCSIDARPLLNRGEHPVDRVILETNKLKENEILELISPFLPKPLIDLLEKKGHKTWTDSISHHLYKTYIAS